MALCSVCVAPARLACSCCNVVFCCLKCQLRRAHVGLVGLVGADSGDAMDESSGEAESSDESAAAESGGGGNESAGEGEGESAMVADAPFPDAPRAPAGKAYMFGAPSPDEKPKFKTHQGHHKILFRRKDGRLFYLPQGARAGYHAWATVPRSVFEKNPLPEGYEVQVHRKGKRWRYRRSPTEDWQESRGKGALTPDGRRIFQVLGNKILAAVLVCSAFWGERPGPEHGIYEAGHAHGVKRDVKPREAAHQLIWLTKEQNDADARRAGVIAKTGQQQAIWARPTDKAPANVRAAWAALGLARVQRDGHAWARFDSQTAAADTLGPSQTAISKVLLGKYAHTKYYMFDWVTVAEPAERDRVQVTATKKGTTFVTRDGRYLQRKTRLDGKPPDWTAFTLTPDAHGYVRVDIKYALLPGRPHFHRLVYRAFADTHPDASANDTAKIERTRKRNAEIDVELKDAALSAEERADLKREKNGLAYEDFEIDHIDGNKINNRLDNLQMLTKLEHNAKTHGVPVVETAGAERGSAELAAFVTITKAARSAGLPPWAMSERLKAGNGYAAISKNGATRHFHKG